MSNAQPSPPRIHTLLRTSVSAMASRLLRIGRFVPVQLLAQHAHPLALRVDLGFSVLRCADQVGHQFRADGRRKPRHQRLGKCLLLVERGPHAKTELGVVFKQRVRPGRSAALRVVCVRRGGQVAAIDRRAARGVGNVQPVAEQLRQQLDVGRFTAARAGARELKERLQKLQVLDLRVRKLGAVHFRQREEELPVFALGLAQRRLRRHVDGLLAGVALALHRANFDADRAAGAIFRSHLQRVALLLHAPPLRLGPLERGGSLVGQHAVVHLGANHGVRANHDALAALDAQDPCPIPG